MSERNQNGRFAQGNPGGPGRPRRTVEREYMAALGDRVSIDAWNRVIDKALADAEAGDAKARDWLARYLLGAEPPSLLSLATDDATGQTVDKTIAENAELLAALGNLKASMAAGN